MVGIHSNGCVLLSAYVILTTIMTQIDAGRRFDKCTSNRNCDAPLTCIHLASGRECNCDREKEFYRNIDEKAKCLNKRKHNQACGGIDAEYQCRADLHLYCQRTHCKCKHTYIYIPSTRACQRVVSHCTGKDDCLPFGHHVQCNNGDCECKAEYYLENNTVCKYQKDFGKECVPGQQQCSVRGGLECKDDKCSCLESKYKDGEDGACIDKKAFGEDCCLDQQDPKDCKKCMGNMVCTDEYKCGCPDEKLHKDGKCITSKPADACVDSKCTGNLQCSGETSETCVQREKESTTTTTELTGELDSTTTTSELTREMDSTTATTKLTVEEYVAKINAAINENRNLTIVALRNLPSTNDSEIIIIDDELLAEYQAELEMRRENNRHKTLTIDDMKDAIVSVNQRQKSEIQKNEKTTENPNNRKNNTGVESDVKTKTTECPNGTFGKNCLQCHCLDRTPCNATTGTCPNGCEPEWQGNTCQEQRTKTITSDDDDDLPMAYIISIAIVGALALLAIPFIAYFIVAAKKRRNDNREGQGQTESQAKVQAKGQAKGQVKGQVKGQAKSPVIGQGHDDDLEENDEELRPDEREDDEEDGKDDDDTDEEDED